ncbi:MAG: hypothetical protein IT320_10425 [Anaerolineae bacterium]|nr:hypothetical protein [Anaerolineae bacterium]
MAVWRLRGHVDEQGKLEFELPGDLQPGEVTITIDAQAEDDLPKFEAKTGAEIAASGVIGAWADQGIEDSVAWVEEVRRREREQRGW